MEHHMLDRDRLRMRRLKLRLSQQQLGQMIGHDQGYVSRLERGEITDITVRTLARLADALRALSQFAAMTVGVFVRRRIQNLAGEPQDTLRFVRPHQISYDVLEIRENLDLRKHFGVGGLHGQIGFSGFRS